MEVYMTLVYFAVTKIQDSFPVIVSKKGIAVAAAKSLRDIEKNV